MGRTPLVLVLCALAGAARADPPRPAYLPSSTARPRPAQGLALRREPGKGWVYEHAGFLARVAEDGTVRFEDRHGEIHLALPLPLPLPEGTPTLEGTLRKLGKAPSRPRTPAGEPTIPGEHMSPYRPSPSEWCAYPHPCYWVARVVLFNAVGTFDINDEILRLNHQDPYRNQKAAFLGSTLAFRQELGQRAAVRARDKALAELRARLAEIDKDSRLDARARRAAIQALADDLDPDPAVSAAARELLDARLAPGPASPLKPSLVARVGQLLDEVVAEEVIGRFRALASHEIEAKPTVGDPDDLVTVVDRVVEARLTRGLAALLPGGAIIGEEAVHARPELLRALEDEGPVWIIDPIDGTRNFARGDDTFGVMIALVDRGATRAAWIALPARRQTFVAEEGAGAYLDGARLSVPAPPWPPRGTLYTRFMPPALAESVSAATRGRYTEHSGAGAAAIEYTSIVRGDKELVVYYRLHPWDHAAGALLLSEAGGCVQHPDGRPYSPRDGNEVTILAASPAVSAEARVWLGPSAP